jgi:crotonobetainyl-CoA:carnitine CoA-transferase CaiB-like acyl-CoA transferase
LAALGKAGIPSEAVLSYDEALAHPQGQARGLAQVFEDAERGPIQHLAPPLRLEGTPARITRRAPDLGEHNAEIRAWLAQGLRRWRE